MNVSIGSPLIHLGVGWEAQVSADDAVAYQVGRTFQFIKATANSRC